MKNILFSIALGALCSCGEPPVNTENEEAMAELKAFEDIKSEEESTKKFIVEYIEVINSKDWKTRIEKYLQPDSDGFLAEHAAFRKSFPNYKMTIEYMTVDGNKAIVWFNCTGEYSSTYNYNNSAYGDEILNGIQASNQKLSWDETWYLNVVDGGFGDQWDFMKDNYAVLDGLGILK